MLNQRCPRDSREMTGGCFKYKSGSGELGDTDFTVALISRSAAFSITAGLKKKSLHLKKN